MKVGTFPFGQPILCLTQRDRNRKRVFVLGVYASAVHARWCDAQGRQIVKALAVASEPYIFWRGEEVEEILSKIQVPPEAGRLKPAAKNLNGPSGRSLDEDYLQPLGLTREDAWLCDLVPHSCKNSGQANAVKNQYEKHAQKFALPTVHWPRVPGKLADEVRRQQIAAELRESAAEVFITLGDGPLKWFSSAFGSDPSLGAYGDDPETYGRLHDLEINGRNVQLLPPVHPRQAAALGRHSSHWNGLHATWKQESAPGLLARH